MKKLFILLIVVLASSLVSARQTADTIFLKSGKYYICEIIDANSYYVQYRSSALTSNIDNIQRGARPKNLLPDIINLKNGNKIICKVTDEGSYLTRYIKNCSSQIIAGLHMRDGRVIPASEFKTFGNGSTSTIQSRSSSAPAAPATIAANTGNNTYRRPRTIIATQRPLDNNQAANITSETINKPQHQASGNELHYVKTPDNPYVTNVKQMNIDPSAQVVVQQVVNPQVSRNIDNTNQGRSDNSSNNHSGNNQSGSTPQRSPRVFIATQTPLSNQEASKLTSEDINKPQHQAAKH